MRTSKKGLWVHRPRLLYLYRWRIPLDQRFYWIWWPLSCEWFKDDSENRLRVLVIACDDRWLRPTDIGDNPHINPTNKPRTNKKREFFSWCHMAASRKKTSLGYILIAVLSLCVVLPQVSANRRAETRIRAKRQGTWCVVSLCLFFFFTMAT